MAEEQKPAPLPQVEVTCPHCGKKFWHKVTDILKAAGEAIGSAVGQAKFGG